MPQAVAAAVAWAATTVASVAGTVAVAAGANWGAALAVRVFTYALVTTGSNLALQAGLAYAVDAATKPKQKPIGSELTFNMDPAYPREMVVGEQLVGGSMVARYSKGSNRKEAHFVIQVADHPCNACNAVYGDNRLQWDTPLVHGVKTEITSYSNSGGARVWMTWHDGRPGQTADMGLVAASALDPEVVAGRLPAWTSNHKGAGNAYVHVEVWYDNDILTSIPAWLFLVKGANFYDRRLDTTAGGSGSHRLNDPSTWAYTTNAAVVWDHWSLGYKVEDDDLAFGLGLSKTELPYAQFAAQADLCDEDVETGTGSAVETIKRYAITGVLTTATYFEDQLEDFQIQMAGRFVDLGGRIGFLGGEEKSIAVSLTDGDLVRGEALQYADKLGFDELYGRVNGNFRDPANLFQATPYQEQVTAYAQLPDGGEAQSVNLDMPLEIHPRRAARLAAAWLARESLQPRLVATFKPKAWKLEPGDWFEYTDAGLQVENAAFEVVDIAKADDFTVTLTARAIDPNFLAFDNDNDPDLSVPPDVPPVDISLDTPSGSLIAVSLSGGGATEPALRFTLASIDDMAREYVIEIQQWTGSAFTGDPWTVTGHSDELVNLIRAGVLPDKQYKARIKARAGRKESAWTSWSSAVSTSATYLVPAASIGTAITGQGALATLNGVYFGSSLITETNGGSSATLGNFKTALGTAAAITGQAPAATDSTIQAGATKNTLTFSGSAPSSPTNGDIWVDTSTTPYVIKSRISGAWQASGSYGGVFGGTLYETGGGAVATLANFKTISGTAAAITGQGPWATTPTTISAVMRPGANLVYDGLLSLKGETWTKGGFSWNKYPEVGDTLYSSVNGDVCYSPAFNVNTSGVYSLQAIVGLSGQISGTSGIYIAWCDSGGVIQAYSSGVSFGNQGFGQVKHENVSNPGYPKARVYCQKGNGGTMWVSHIKIEEGVACTAFSDESTPADLTVDHTAAAISGQGNFATVNFVRQSSDPGGSEGKWWVDTTNNQLKLYTGGAWQVVADIGSGIKLSMSSAINIIGSSGFSGTITVTATGGNGSYTYRWYKGPYESGQSATLSNTSTATVTVAASLSTGQDSTGRVYCEVRDSAGLVAVYSQSYNFSKTS